jgi:dTMP kinase
LREPPGGRAPDRLANSRRLTPVCERRGSPEAQTLQRHTIAGKPAACTLPRMLISFEGPEGSGKSTQIALLARRLRETGREVVETKEPGGTPVGEAIREVLLHRQVPISPVVELLLYSASRAALVREVIRPALKQGAIVLTDRFADASRVYQGVAGGTPPLQVELVTSVATDGVEPDMTVILDIDPTVGLGRANHRGALDRLESKDLAYHQRVRQGYLDLARANPDRCVVVDAQAAEGVVAALIWSVVEARLGR